MIPARIAVPLRMLGLVGLLDAAGCHNECDENIHNERCAQRMVTLETLEPNLTCLAKDTPGSVQMRATFPGPLRSQGKIRGELIPPKGTDLLSLGEVYIPPNGPALSSFTFEFSLSPSQLATGTHWLSLKQQIAEELPREFTQTANRPPVVINEPGKVDFEDGTIISLPLDAMVYANSDTFLRGAWVVGGNSILAIHAYTNDVGVPTAKRGKFDLSGVRKPDSSLDMIWTFSGPIPEAQFAAWPFDLPSGSTPYGIMAEPAASLAYSLTELKVGADKTERVATKYGQIQPQPGLRSIAIALPGDKTGGSIALLTIDGSGLVAYKLAATSPPNQTKIDGLPPVAAGPKQIQITSFGDKLGEAQRRGFIITYPNSDPAFVTWDGDKLSYSAEDSKSLKNIGSGASGVAAGDLDGDGRTDIVMARPSGVDLYLASCSGGFQYAGQKPLSPGISPTVVAVGQVDDKLGNDIIVTDGTPMRCTGSPPDVKCPAPHIVLYKNRRQ